MRYEINVKENRDFFNTKDLGQAAFLSLSGFPPKLIVDSAADMVIFAFPRTPELMEALRRYREGEKISAMAYSVAMSALRKQMYLTKEGR